MVTVIHFIILAYCTYECVISLKNMRGRFVKIVIFGALGLIHGLVPVFTPSTYMWSTNKGTILLAAFLALGGIIVFAAGWRLIEGRRPDWDGLSPGLDAYITSPGGQKFLKRMFWLSGIVALTGWLLSLIVTAGSLSAAFQAGRFEYRASGNVYLSVFFVHMAHLITIPGFLCFFLSRTYRVLGIAFTLAMALLIFLGSQGARAESLGLIGALVIGYMLRSRMSIHRFLLVCAGGAAIILLGVAMYEVRKTMSRNTLGEMAQKIVTAETYQGALLRDPLNYHQFLLAAIDHFPKDHPYLNGATYIRLLLFYLPQQYFPGIKPPDTHNTFARAITTFSSETTIPPTMMGDGYINFWGPPGVFIVMFLNGLLFGLVSFKIRDRILWLIVFGGPFCRLALIMIRGAPYEVLLLCLSSISLAYVLSWFCGVRIRGINSLVADANRSARAGGLALYPSAPAVQNPG